MLRGKVDEWRFYRNGFNLIHGSLVGKDRANILEVIPLPFDDEIKDEFERARKSSDDELIEQYWMLEKAGLLKAVVNG